MTLNLKNYMLPAATTVDSAALDLTLENDAVF